MSSIDQAGRIHKVVFVVTNLTLFALCCIATCARLYTRLRVQKQFSIDDGVFLFGMCCLISVEAILFTFIDSMYLVEALFFSDIAGVSLPSDFRQESFDFQKMAALTLGLTWFAIHAVKFSLLILFRKLIDRLKPLVIYWWVVVIYNLAVLGYGTAVCYLECPYFYNLQAFQCTQASGEGRTIDYVLPRMVLDIAGDAMILFIPISLIWRVRIRPVQKLALAFSLCLTALVVVVTVIQVSGLEYEGKLDAVWGIYWIIIEAECGLILTAATAVRAFIVSRSTERRPRLSSEDKWYTRSKRLFRRTFSLWTWRTKTIPDSSGTHSEGTPDLKVELPRIPQATITGIRSIIGGIGKNSLGASQLMQSQIMEEHEDGWPLFGKSQEHPRDNMEHGIASIFERVSRDTHSWDDMEYAGDTSNISQPQSRV